MVAVLLTILKTLGIILLVLLGVILTVVLLILFAPIRYKIRVHRKTEDETPIVADVRVTYLAHIVNAAFTYPEMAYLRVRIFCFTIFRSDRPKSGAKNASSEREKEYVEKETQDKKQHHENEAENTPKAVKTEVIEKEAEAAKEDSEGKPEKEKSGSVRKAPNKVFEFFGKIWSVLKNIRYTIGRICDKIKDIVNNIKYYVEILQSDRFDRGFRVCKEQLRALFKMLRPRKITGELLIGTGDPASTGQVMAAYGVLYPLVGSHINVTADFERQIVEGSLFVKGRITIFGLIKCAWIIYFNKDIRELIKLFKREAV